MAPAKSMLAYLLVYFFRCESEHERPLETRWWWHQEDRGAAQNREVDPNECKLNSRLQTSTTNEWMANAMNLAERRADEGFLCTMKGVMIDRVSDFNTSLASFRNPHDRQAKEFGKNPAYCTTFVPKLARNGGESRSIFTLGSFAFWPTSLTIELEKLDLCKAIVFRPRFGQRWQPTNRST